MCDLEYMCTMPSHDELVRVQVPWPRQQLRIRLLLEHDVGEALGGLFDGSTLSPMLKGLSPMLGPAAALLNDLPEVFLS